MSQKKNEVPQVIDGGNFADERGHISFVNAFHFKNIKRFYCITHLETDLIRAWQGHKIETKYFYVVSGRFLISAVKIDHWENPSALLKGAPFILSSEKSQLLKIPGGYANGFKALDKNSKMIIYSDLTLEDSEKDNIRFFSETWQNWDIYK